MAGGSFPFSFPNLDMDVDGKRREIESLRLLIASHERRHKDRSSVAVQS